MNNLIKLTTYIKAIVFVLLFSPPVLAMETQTNVYSNVFTHKHVQKQDTDLATGTLQTIYLGFGATDLLTSLNLSRIGGEINPILGPKPSILTYSLVLPAAFGATTGLAAALNTRDRNTVLFFAGFGEVYSVIANLEGGLSPILVALPTVFIGVGIGILAGGVTYYIAKEILTYFHYYDYQPAPFVSRPWPLKGERHERYKS